MDVVSDTAAPFPSLSVTELNSQLEMDAEVTSVRRIRGTERVMGEDASEGEMEREERTMVPLSAFTIPHAPSVSMKLICVIVMVLVVRDSSLMDE